MRNKSKTRSVGYGWVGRWDDGTLGWFLPNHLTGYRNDGPNDNEHLKGETVFKCRITIEQVLSTNGREITKRIPE